LNDDNAALPEPAPSQALDAWTEWALAQADSIDPVASGRFLEDLIPPMMFKGGTV
jgi:hypothetical protein